MISIGGITLHLYGLIIGFAVWCAWEIALREIRKKKLDEEYFNDVAFLAVVGGVIGARLYHVADYWQEYYANNLYKIFYLWEGGLGIWGAIIGGLLFILAYHYIFLLLNKDSRVNVFFILDAIVTGLPLAQTIGRMGNLFNDELWGKNGEPLFFYEGLLNLALFTFLFKLAKRKNKPGFLTGVYLVGYGLIRLGLDPFRSSGDIYSIDDISVAVMIAIMSILLGLFLIFRRKQS